MSDGSTWSASLCGVRGSGVGGGVGVLCESLDRRGLTEGVCDGLGLAFDSLSLPDCAATFGDHATLAKRRATMTTLTAKAPCQGKSHDFTTPPARRLLDSLFLEAKYSTLSGLIRPGIDGGHAFYESGVDLVHPAGAAERR